MDWVKTVLNLDRRIIYSIVAALVIIPLIFPLRLPVIATDEVKGIYDYVEELPDGSNILVAGDFDPASKPELYPMMIAFLSHCFEKDHKVHILTLWPGGPSLMQKAVEDTAAMYDKEKNVDWVYYGYKPGSQAVILGLANNIGTTFRTDHYGTATSSMQILSGITKLSDFDYIIDVAAGATVELWIAYGSAPEGVPMGASCTAVSAAGYYPYLGAKQITGLAGGMKGTAEYEKLLADDYPTVGDSGNERELGKAIVGMDAQSAVHIFIVLSIILANAAFFVQGKRESAERRR